MNERDLTSVYLRVLAEKAEDSLERDHDALENAHRLAEAVKSRAGKSIAERLIVGQPVR